MAGKSVPSVTMDTIEKCAFVVKIMFYECRSVVQVQHKFRSHFHGQLRQIPIEMNLTGSLCILRKQVSYTIAEKGTKDNSELCEQQLKKQMKHMPSCTHLRAPSSKGSHNHLVNYGRRHINLYGTIFVYFLKLAIHSSWNNTKCEKWKECSGVFLVTFFVSFFSCFAFCPRVGIHMKHQRISYHILFKWLTGYILITKFIRLKTTKHNWETTWVTNY